MNLGRPFRWIWRRKGDVIYYAVFIGLVGFIVWEAKHQTNVRLDAIRDNLKRTMELRGQYLEDIQELRIEFNRLRDYLEGELAKKADTDERLWERLGAIDLQIDALEARDVADDDSISGPSP